MVKLFSSFFAYMSQQKHSLVFCPKCGTLLDPPSGTDDNIDCHACGNTVAASLFEAQKVFTQSRPEAFPNRPKIDKIVDKYAHLKDGATVTRTNYRYRKSAQGVVIMKWFFILRN